MQSKKAFDKDKNINLALLYLMTNDGSDNNRYDEMMDRWHDVDQDPRYDVYRDDPRYNDVFTPPNYWETHQDDSENTYEKEANYEYNSEEKITDHKENKSEIIENKEERKATENTPATIPDEKTPIIIDTDKNSQSNNQNMSSQDNGLLGIFGIICIAVIVILGLLVFAPWLLLIVIPIILCAIFPKKR